MKQKRNKTKKINVKARANILAKKLRSEAEIKKKIKFKNVSPPNIFGTFCLGVYHQLECFCDSFWVTVKESYCCKKIRLLNGYEITKKRIRLIIQTR